MSSQNTTGWLLLVVAAGAVVGAAFTVAPVPLLMGLALAGAAVVFLVVRRSALWALALLVFALVPLTALDVPGVLLTVTPPLLLLLVIAVRRLLDGSGPPRLTLRPVCLLLLAYAGWLAVTALASDYRDITVGWLFSFIGLVILPALLGTTEPRLRDPLRYTWVALGGVLGLYAVAETFVLQSNPLMDILFDHHIEQRWSVYRATTTLGHPVSNGLFFAITVPLAVGLAVQRRSGLAAAAALLAAGGVVASGTRSAFAAMLLGAALAVLLPYGRGPVQGAQRLARTIGTATMVGVLVAGWAYLAVRESSGEGQRSAAFRGDQVPVAWEAVEQRPLLGTGPGAASFSHEPLLARIGGAGAFESYWLELVVGAGLPGLFLGVLVTATAGISALRSGAPDVAGAIATWAAAVTFINALEGGRPEFLLLGLLLAMAFSRKPAWQQAPSGRPEPLPGGAGWAPAGGFSGAHR